MGSLSASKFPKKLRPEEVKYLALEGGGGKGFAYLGAIELLDERKILEQIEGVAGTSAGAITALMISLKMNSKEITEKIKNTDFNSFFDAALPRMIPVPCVDPRLESGYLERTDNTALETTLLASSLDYKTLQNLIQTTKKFGKRGPENLVGWTAYAALSVLKVVSSGLGNFYDDLFRDLPLKPPMSTLIKEINNYLAYYNRDMGFFSGLAARNAFDALICRQAVKIDGGKLDSYRNMPFLRHKEIFGKELLVCGSNLSTRKTELFSSRPEHTPYFPVADAVRISMGLPLIYKPYVLSKRIPGWPPCGTYVDGGLWNNIPLREIEPIQNSRSSDAVWPAHTLALRLEIDKSTRVETASSILEKMLGNIIGAGETQVLRELQRMTIELDSEPLTLLEFKPDDKIAEVIHKRSRRAISKYFKWQVSEKDQDPEDDAKRSRADICG